MIYAQIPYRIEPELAGPRPRRVRFTAETQKRRFRAYCVALIPLMVVLVYGLKATEYQEALLTTGKTVEAQIISTSYVDDGRSSTVGLSGEHVILFKFQADGVTVMGRGVEDSDPHVWQKVGDTTVVTYIPGHPQSFVQGRVAHWQVVQKDWDWIIGSGLIGIASALYLFLVERYFWQRYILLRNGVTAGATVLSHVIAEAGETATYFVRYEYSNALHVKFEGKFGVSPKRFRDFPDGSKLTVLCKPNSKEPGLPYVQIAEAGIVKTF